MTPSADGAKQNPGSSPVEAPHSASLHAGYGIGTAARTRLAGFARTLRDNGFKVGLAETRDALAVLASPASARPSALRPALRSLFCATHSDWQRFDEIFDAYWLGRGMRRARQVTGTTSESRLSVKRMAETADAAGRARPARSRRAPQRPGERHSPGRTRPARRRLAWRTADDDRPAPHRRSGGRGGNPCARRPPGAVDARAARAPPAGRTGAGAASTCAAPSTATSATAARRSIWPGASAR